MTSDEYNAHLMEVWQTAMALGGTVAVLLCLVLGMVFVKALTS